MENVTKIKTEYPIKVEINSWPLVGLFFVFLLLFAIFSDSGSKSYSLYPVDDSGISITFTDGTTEVITDAEEIRILNNGNVSLFIPKSGSRYVLYSNTSIKKIEKVSLLP